MADTLYLSLWYPDLRLPALAEKLNSVLSSFAAHGGEPLVYSATVWPVNWSQPPVFQQIYGRRIGAAGDGKTALGAEPALAVEQAIELLHDDFAYEFQIGWSLWELEELAPPQGPRWARSPHMVHVTGFGPLFEEGTYQSDGHIRIDFGTDTPFLAEDLDLDSIAAHHIEENIRQLISLTAAVEKASGASARLLWSELGESLAERLAARLLARPQ